MGGGPSKQCNPGTFGTGPGVSVNYQGNTQNLGGTSICTVDLAECMRECEALGCADAGGCCKTCQSQCCVNDGPARNPSSPICHQMTTNAPPLPDDYCGNPASRADYDRDCPTGCLDGSEMNVDSESNMIKGVAVKRGGANFLAKTSSKCGKTEWVLFIILLAFLILMLMGYL